MKKVFANWLLMPALITALSSIFVCHARAQVFNTLHAFSGSEGANPSASLILSGNTLYGTALNGGASGNGTLFQVSTSGTDFTNLYGFTANGFHSVNFDGANPNAGLILSGSTLYGTALGGGLDGDGTVFSFNINASAFTTLYYFLSLQNYPPGTNSDGAGLQAGVILSGNTFYGTAFRGGTLGAGTVFSINDDGTDFTTLYNFTGGSDGALPYASLVLSGNILFGTTLNGGTLGNGTLFSLSTAGTGYTVLHKFSAATTNGLGDYINSDGAHPYAGLILSGNMLYGTTTNGGSYGQGTVFAINTNGSDFTVLYTFSALATNGTGVLTNRDGANPYAGLVLSGNTLYGTAMYGGNSGHGTVFAINVNGSGFTNLYNFAGGSDGGSPLAGLILSDGTLYGSAYNGGNWGLGTVFSLDLGAVSTPPKLTLMRSGTDIILTWSGTGFTLESATNLDPPVVWAIVSGQNAVTNPIAGAKKFYRLSQ